MIKTSRKEGKYYYTVYSVSEWRVAVIGCYVVEQYPGIINSYVRCPIIGMKLNHCHSDGIKLSLNN